MLVLSRHKDEKIVLRYQDVTIVLTAVAIKGGSSVKIGIDAPPEVRIDRAEALPPDRLPEKDS